MKFIFGPKHEFVRFDVHGYEQAADSQDNHDRNWLRVDVSVSVGSFRGNEHLAILTWDIEKLLPELEKLYQTLNGSAKFETLENQVELEFVGDGIGHIQMAGRLTSSANPDRNELTFHLYFDQTDLAASIAQLKQVINVFPRR